MRNRSRYIRRVRSVDHRKWRRWVLWAQIERAVADEMIKQAVYGDMSGEPLGLISLGDRIQVLDWGPVRDA